LRGDVHEQALAPVDTDDLYGDRGDCTADLYPAADRLDSAIMYA